MADDEDSGYDENIEDEEMTPAEREFDEDDSEEIKEDMEEGELDEDVYSEEGREKLLEDDEIDSDEEGFMEGAEEDGDDAKCRECGKELLDFNFIEKEIKGNKSRFCSEECLEKYEEEHK